MFPAPLAVALPPHVLLALIALPPVLLAAGAWAVLRRRAIDRWVVSYVRAARTRRPPDPAKPVHLLLCIADHYEPQYGRVPADRAASRVEAWTSNYPRLFDRFRDADG